MSSATEYLAPVSEDGYLQIPSDLIPYLEDQETKTVVINRGFERNLCIYRKKEWFEIANKLDKLNLFKKSNREFKRYFLSGAVEAQITGNGTIFLPKVLLNYSGITFNSDALVYKLGNDFLELWNPNQFKEIFSTENPDFTDLAQEVLFHNSTDDELIELFRKEPEVALKYIRQLESDAHRNINVDNLKYKAEMVGGKKQLFICYSSLDSDFATKLVYDLQLNEIPVWFDQRELLPGDSLYETIQRGIKKSGYFAIILSPNSVSSPWCKLELNAALESELEKREVFIIPILYEKCEIPMFIKGKKYVDFPLLGYENGMEFLLTRFN